SALEEIRMLSNFETEKSKLIQIVLVGQPGLRDLLARHDLEQLRQRVTVTYHIDPLTSEDTHAYVNHRLRHASVGAPITFSRPVTEVIHTYSRGVARTINVIADAVLLYGYGRDTRVIDLELTNEVVNDLGLSDASAVLTADAPAAVAVQPATAAAHTSGASGATASSTDTPVMPASSPALEAFAPEGGAAMQTRPQSSAMQAQMRSEETSSLRRAHSDLPLQTPAAAPAPPPPYAPAPVSRVNVNSSYYALTEAPPPHKPAYKSWWSRLRRGVTGQPVEV